MPRSGLASLLFALLVPACGGGHGSDHAAGTELGPCVQHQFCDSPLQCVEDVCVNPDQLPATGGAESGASASQGASGSHGDGMLPDVGSGMSTSGGGTGNDGGADIYCGTEGGEYCVCGHTADYGPHGATCSSSTVDAPARCCADEGWPAYGGCSCWTMSCRQVSSDTCVCGVGNPSSTDTPVSSCTSDGGICCVDDTTCSCWTDLTSCLDGATEVSSCTAESVGCGSSTQVDACN